MTDEKEWQPPKPKTATRTRYYQGKYTPKHPEKWVNPKAIIYRSRWELFFMRWLDACSNVTHIASEEMSICYFDPTTKRIRRYFPDFVIKVEHNGIKQTIMIEIKPFAQTIKPVSKKNKRTTLKEASAFAINEAKWAAAQKWCEDRKIIFKVITEKELFGDKDMKRLNG